MLPVQLSWFYFLENFILALVIIGISARLACRIVRVRGESMYPTFVDGDQLIILYWWPKRLLYKGQIVVSKPRQKVVMGQQFYHIKRVVATAGETVIVPLSEIPVSSPLHASVQYHDKHGLRSWQIPPHHVFVRGDNRANSLDSVTFGPLPFEKIDGVVLMKLPWAFLLFPHWRG